MLDNLKNEFSEFQMKYIELSMQINDVNAQLLLLKANRNYKHNIVIRMQGEIKLDLM